MSDHICMTPVRDASDRFVGSKRIFDPGEGEQWFSNELVSNWLLVSSDGSEVVVTADNGTFVYKVLGHDDRRWHLVLKSHVPTSRKADE